VLSFAAIALAAASTAITPTLTSNTPWWEKITVTYDGNGSHRACNYETSLAYAQTQEACEVGSARADADKAAASNAGVQTKITFERRFTPGTPPELDSLQPGDTLIGGLMMLVAIGEDGAVRAWPCAHAPSSRKAATTSRATAASRCGPSAFRPASGRPLRTPASAS
jgi:hypothetical protein